MRKQFSFKGAVDGLRTGVFPDDDKPLKVTQFLLR